MYRFLSNLIGFLSTCSCKIVFNVHAGSLLIVVDFFVLCSDTGVSQRLEPNTDLRNEVRIMTQVGFRYLEHVRCL